MTFKCILFCWKPELFKATFIFVAYSKLYKFFASVLKLQQQTQYDFKSTKLFKFFARKSVLIIKKIFF